MRRFLGLAALLLTGCIDNNIPYPVVELAITGIEGEGFTCTAEDIDLRERTATLHLTEQVDIHRVKIDKISVSENAVSDTPLSGEFNLHTPQYITLSYYQDYEWKIVADQQIERYFEVEGMLDGRSTGQIGATEIDAVNKIAIARVPEQMDASTIRIKRLKLGPEGITTYDPLPETLTWGESQLRYIDISYHENPVTNEKWSLYVLPTDVTVTLTQADAWSRVIWLYGEGLSGTELGFRYRKAGDEQWIDVPVESQSGAFSTCLEGVEPEQAYEVKAYSGEKESPTRTVTTETAPELPNGGFEKWETVGKSVFPYLSTDDIFYWGTGNPGASIGNATLTDKTADKRPGSAGTYAARLESQHVGVVGITKMAAGNLFTGSYIATIGSNGIVGFGQYYDRRPTALRGWFKYEQGVLSMVGKQPFADRNLEAGRDMDEGAIYIALGTWTPGEYGVSDYGGKSEMYGTAQTPVIIDTRVQGTFTLFKEKDKGGGKFGKDIVAYGEKLLTGTTAEWTEFVIPLDYSEVTDRVPTHIIVVCSASRWGDYFTGSNESVLYVDDFELVYDEWFE